MSKPKKHAKFAASNSERWVQCPSSLRLYEWALKQPNIKLVESTSAAAEEGTTAHALMEEVLEADIKNVVKFYERDEQYPLEMRKHVQGYVDFVRAEMKPHYELLIEEKVVLDFLHPTEAFGTVDTGIIEPFGMLHIIDFKYGQGFVNHRDNPQMIYYALGIAYKLHFDFDKIKTTIYQPRAGSTEPARTDEFSVQKLKSWQDIFAEAIEKYFDADHESDLCAGSWCKFCPVKMICPAISKSALESAQLDFSAPVQPAPKFLTSDQLKTILDRSAYLELWIKEVKRYAEEQIRSGKKIQGWGLEPKKAQRVWKNAELFKEGKTSSIKGYKRLKAYDLKFLKTEAKSVAEVEKEMKSAKVPKDLIEQFLKDNSVSVSSGDKLSSTTNDYDDHGLDDLIID